MRKTIFMALLAAVLVLVPTVVPSAAFAADREEILRDCADDGIIQGSYTASEMRDARSNMPAELDEYSDCRDVLSREISAKTAGTKETGGGGGGDTSGGGGTTSGTGGSTGGTTSSDPAPAPTQAPTGRDPGIQVGPSTPDDFNAIDAATRTGSAPIKVSGREISPAASVGRNGLPGTVIAVLALLAAAGLAMTVSLVRHRVVTRSTPA